MNIVLLGVIIVLLLVCIILVAFIIVKNNKKENVSDSSNKLSSFGNSNKIEFENLSLPIKIEKMDSHTLFQACSKVFDSFKALDYANKTEHELDKIEWHSWQVSLLLALLKKDRSFFIPKTKNLFHLVISQSNNAQVEEQIKRILVKYEQNVNIQKTRDDLSSDIIWSSSEVSYIFYYMINK